MNCKTYAYIIIKDTNIDCRSDDEGIRFDSPGENPRVGGARRHHPFSETDGKSGIPRRHEETRESSMAGWQTDLPERNEIRSVLPH